MLQDSDLGLIIRILVFVNYPNRIRIGSEPNLNPSHDHYFIASNSILEVTNEISFFRNLYEGYVEMTNKKFTKLYFIDSNNNQFEKQSKYSPVPLRLNKGHFMQ